MLKNIIRCKLLVLDSIQYLKISTWKFLIPIFRVGSTVWIGNDHDGPILEETPTDQFNIGGFNGGGGFSHFFDMPSYQKNAVSNYLKVINDANMAPSTYFNSSKRVNRSDAWWWMVWLDHQAYPDVSMNGAWYIMAADNQFMNGTSFYYEFGTSASSPAFAGFIAAINDYLMSTGQPPLGFLNPLLYQVSIHSCIADETLVGCQLLRCIHWSVGIGQQPMQCTVLLHVWIRICTRMGCCNRFGIAKLHLHS